MDKNAIKKYAVWARRELIARVSQRASLYEITPDKFGNPDAFSVHGRILSAEERSQRKALITKIQEKNYEQVMEEVAYTWFNRFSALRFMEVNGYLPSHVRVFTDDENNFKPQIMTEAINLELDGLDLQKVYEYKNDNDNEALFKYLIITQCNALSSILPGMFQKILDYTELLFPDNLLREGSVVEQMIAMIPEEDWTDQVQIIGWLYQYYNTEPKDQVFANLKKNIKISKENIPAATQLFTPEWIVRYMVENSLGRLWVEGHPNNDLKAKWKYYLEETEQEPEVQEQLKEIRKKYAKLSPEEIRCIDPCMGSGHILIYMFDVLMQIYEACGYNSREAVVSIIENNLWGLDIDDRATQFAYFSVMMKARQYDRRFFERGIQPHAYAILESNNLDTNCIEYFIGQRKDIESAMNTLIKELHDAKEYGSILNVTQVDFDVFYNRFEEIKSVVTPNILNYQVLNTLLPFIQTAQAMAQNYNVVVTNPPYMGSGGMSAKLSSYVTKNYPEGKNDLFAVFMQKCNQMTKTNSFQAMITQNSWMFLSTFENLRKSFSKTDFVNMIHLGARAFEEISGEVVQTTSFVFRLSSIHKYMGQYFRLVEGTNQDEKEKMFLDRQNRFFVSQNDYSKIPGSPVAYWVSKTFSDIFNNKSIEKFTMKICKGGFTGNNEKYLRLWFEVNTKAIPGKWNLYSKGGGYRKWYGNSMHLILWENDGFALKHDPKAGVGASKYYGKEHFVWSGISTGLPSFRYDPCNVYFDDVSPALVFSDIPNWKLLALLNSKIVQEVLKIIAPTMHFQAGDIKVIPVPQKIDTVDEIIVKENIKISKEDWDAFETSWDFIMHPLIRNCTLLKEAFRQWEEECYQRFNTLMKNEKFLNQIIISLFGLDNELTPDVDEAQISIRKANFHRDIKNLISYIVGCMFGRYSLDFQGLVYAGGEWDSTKYKTFEADEDNIIPICDDEYFNDDIVGRFIKFVEVVYGKETLEENLKFIADALGGNGSPREVIRNYFINGFYADHLKVYQKRPIYWLFDSGKKNGFKCLVYMHRYQPDTIARIRTDYVHEQQSRYRTAMADLQSRIDNATSTSERVKLSKKLKAVQEQDEELRIYEEKIHHLADQMISIDLDDGVKVNYAKFQDVLAKIK